jgi:hypothetical protein
MSKSLTDVIQDLKSALHDSQTPLSDVAQIRQVCMEFSPQKMQPIDFVRWVPLEQVQANDYNPNSVAPNEMRLLYVSISQDGYTQPIVTIYDHEIDKYIIVDGFHRYTVMKINKDIYDANNGLCPIVVIDKDINERMASTVRHNRARGKHAVAGMSKVVFDLLKNGVSDDEICQQVGLEAEELVRLKYVTGFAKLFESVEYGQAWETDVQIKHRIENTKADNEGN